MHLIIVQGPYKQKLFDPVKGFCPLGGGVVPEAAKIVVLGTEILIRKIAIEIRVKDCEYPAFSFIVHLLETSTIYNDYTHLSLLFYVCCGPR